MPTIYIALHFFLLSVAPAAMMGPPNSAPQAAADAVDAPQTQPATQPDAPADDQPAPDDDEPADDGDDAHAAADAHPDPQLDALLEKLETSAQDLRTFTADITFRKFDDLLNRRETRTGKIIYQSQPVEGVPGAFLKKFGIIFDALIVNSRRSEHEKHYIFDGRWLAEIDHENKLFIAREVVPPGEVLDPLKLGEGPFPLPIGQQKEEVYDRFVVERIDAPVGGLLGGLENVTGILLIPRQDQPDSDQFRRVEVFYDNDTLLPVGIEAVENNGDRKIVRLRNVQRNPELTAEQHAQIRIVQPDPARWKIDKRPWQGGQ